MSRLAAELKAASSVPNLQPAFADGECVSLNFGFGRKAEVRRALASGCSDKNTVM
jgi:hypothetical protein